MKNLLSILRLSFLFAILLSTSSCWKDEISFKPNPVSGDYNSFFEQVQSLEQIEIVDVALGKEIKTEKGTRISVPKNAFENQTGNPVSGKVDFEIIELDTPGEMITYNSLSEHGDLDAYFIGTERQIYINPIQNGEKLVYSEGKSIQIRFKVDTDKGEQSYFWGDDFEEEVYWTDSAIDVPYTNWEVYDSTQMESVNESGYVIGTQTEQLSWYQIGTTIDLTIKETTPVQVILPEELFSSKNTKVYIVFNQYNSVLSLEPNTQDGSFISDYELPLGESVHFIAISSLGSETYSIDIKESIIAENHLEFLVPEDSSIPEILEELYKI